MKMRCLSAFTLALGVCFTLNAQSPIYPATNGDPTHYPVQSTIQGEEQRLFDASFAERSVGFMHVYADPKVDPLGDYLLAGEMLPSAAYNLLPADLKMKVRQDNMKAYGAAAIKGKNENLYLLRLDGPTSDRIELLALRGGEVTHLRTLAVWEGGSETPTQQMDSYITDVDGNTHLDIVTIKRDGEGAIGKKSAYVLDLETRNFVETDELDVPWASMELYRPSVKK